MACSAEALAARIATLQTYAAFFQKPWNLERKIRPRTMMLLPATEPQEDILIAECKGTASLRLESNEETIWTRRVLLRYDEAGDMKLAAHPNTPLKFTKSYFYELSADTGALELKIYFDTGPETAITDDDLFCTFNLSKATIGSGDPVPSTEHLCQCDRYWGELLLEDDSTWHLRYQCSGPNKDTVIETRFTLAGAAGEEADVDGAPKTAGEDSAPL